MSFDFYKPIKHVCIYRTDKVRTDVSRMERAIRLYCTQYGAQWSLQIRGRRAWAPLVCVTAKRI